MDEVEEQGGSGNILEQLGEQFGGAKTGKAKSNQFKIENLFNPKTLESLGKALQDKSTLDGLSGIMKQAQPLMRQVTKQFNPLLKQLSGQGAAAPAPSKRPSGRR